MLLVEFCCFVTSHGLVIVKWTKQNGSCNSLTDMQGTFASVETWLKEIDRYASANVQSLLVGNMYDMAYLRAMEKETVQV